MGLKQNQTQVKIAIYNAKIWRNRRELLFKVVTYVRAVICVTLVNYEFYSMAVSQDYK